MSDESEGKGSAAPVINIHGNVGILNSGVIKNVQDLSVSIGVVQQSQPELSESIKVLAEAVANSSELDDAKKEETLDRLNEVTVQVSEPEEKRLPAYKIKDQIKGITECVKGVGALKELWEKAWPLLAAALGLGQ